MKILNLAYKYAKVWKHLDLGFESVIGATGSDFRIQSESRSGSDSKAVQVKYLNQECC